MFSTQEEHQVLKFDAFPSFLELYIPEIIIELQFMVVVTTCTFSLLLRDCCDFSHIAVTAITISSKVVSYESANLQRFCKVQFHARLYLGLLILIF